MATDRPSRSTCTYSNLPTFLKQTQPTAVRMSTSNIFRFVIVTSWKVEGEVDHFTRSSLLGRYWCGLPKKIIKTWVMCNQDFERLEPGKRGAWRSRQLIVGFRLQQQVSSPTLFCYLPLGTPTNSTLYFRHALSPCLPDKMIISYSTAIRQTKCWSRSCRSIDHTVITIDFPRGNEVGKSPRLQLADLPVPYVKSVSTRIHHIAPAVHRSDRTLPTRPVRFPTVLRHRKIFASSIGHLHAPPLTRKKMFCWFEIGLTAAVQRVIWPESLIVTY